MSDTIRKKKLLKWLDNRILEYKDSNMELHKWKAEGFQDLVGYIKSGFFDTDGWISVKERMPESSHVLVIDKNYNQTVADYAHGRFWPDNLNISTIEVTHWMPLPEPPKGEDNA